MSVVLPAWEEVDFQKSGSRSLFTERSQVPGGWLVRATLFDAHHEPIGVALAFVPATYDRDGIRYEWDEDDAP